MMTFAADYVTSKPNQIMHIYSYMVITNVDMHWDRFTIRRFEVRGCIDFKFALLEVLSQLKNYIFPSPFQELTVFATDQ